MRTHFFSRADISGRSAFRSYYIFQNLKTIQICSIVYFTFSLLVRFIFSFYSLSDKVFHHINDYNTANWIALTVTPLFCLTAYLLIKRFKPDKKYLITAQTLVYIMALFIIIGGMRATFFIMYNPRNTLVFYFMALIVTAIFFTFEYYETLLIAVITSLLFLFLLPFYQHSLNELILNNLASLLLLIIFCFISRFFYSYRCDNFFRLKAIEEKNIEIENASNAKNEILGIVAHDLRNPLAIIQSITSLMALDDEIGDDYHENLQMIRASCDKASSIINDLLETAQNEIINELELEKTDLNQFLAVITNEWMKNKLGQVDIQYHTEGKPVFAYIHHEKMQRVMDNLISNALKFSGRNDTIDISMHESENHIIISVKDYGIGIPAELIPYIFDRFSKARRNGVRGEASVGLGLSIVKQIVNKHNGDIEVTSTKEAGTIFTITLPNT